MGHSAHLQAVIGAILDSRPFLAAGVMQTCQALGPQASAPVHILQFTCKWR